MVLRVEDNVHVLNFEEEYRGAEAAREIRHCSCMAKILSQLRTIMMLLCL